MESIHVELSNERRHIGVFKVLTIPFGQSLATCKSHSIGTPLSSTYAKTLENSLLGVTIKLSFVLDHVIKC